VVAAIAANNEEQVVDSSKALDVVVSVAVAETPSSLQAIQHGQLAETRMVRETSESTRFAVDEVTRQLKLERAQNDKLAKINSDMLVELKTQGGTLKVSREGAPTRVWSADHPRLWQHLWMLWSRVWR
jgi:hypothetical protein